MKTYRTGVDTGEDGRKHRFVALEPAKSEADREYERMKVMIVR